MNDLILCAGVMLYVIPLNPEDTVLMCQKQESSGSYPDFGLFHTL